MVSTIAHTVFVSAFVAAVIGPVNLLCLLGVLLALVLVYTGSLDLASGRVGKGLLGLFLLLTGVFGAAILTGELFWRALGAPNPLWIQIGSL